MKKADKEALEALVMRVWEGLMRCRAAGRPGDRGCRGCPYLEKYCMDPQRRMAVIPELMAEEIQMVLEGGRQLIEERGRTLTAASERSKRYYQAHAEERKAKAKAYRLEHMEESAGRSRRWRAENLEARRAYERAYYLENREKIRAYQREWYAAKRARELEEEQDERE